jgi:predicted permease
MILTKMAASLTPQLLTTLWFLPVSAVAVLVLAIIVTSLVIHICSVPPKYRAFVLVAVSFNNCVSARS